jgi:hypothetical protein
MIGVLTTIASLCSHTKARIKECVVIRRTGTTLPHYAQWTKSEQPYRSESLEAERLTVSYLPTALLPKLRRRLLVGKGLHRIGKRRNSDFTVPGSLPAPSSRRTRVVRSSRSRGPRGTSRTRLSIWDRRILLQPLLVPRQTNL